MLSDYQIVYLCCNLIGSYIIYLLIHTFYQQSRVRVSCEIASYIGFFAVTSLVYLFLDLPIANLLVNLIGLYLITILYTGKARKRFFVVGVVYLVLAITETIVYVANGWISPSVWKEGRFNDIIGLLEVKIFTLIVALFMKRMYKRQDDQILTRKYWILLVLVPAFTIYNYILLFSSVHVRSSMIVISLVIALLVNFAVFYLYEELTSAMHDRMERVKLEEQNRFYVQQLEIMKESNERVRALRHDMKNHFITMDLMLAHEQHLEMQQYLTRCVKQCENEKEYAKTGNLVIDSVLNYKLQETSRRNIEVICDLKIPQQLQLPWYDMTVILGNLIDNALEALTKVENRKLEISIYYVKESLIIEIKNSYNGILHIENGKIATSKAEKDGHGIGLNNVRVIVVENQGTMKVETTKTMFDVSIILPGKQNGNEREVK